MKSVKNLKKERDEIVQSLTAYSGAIAGSFCACKRGNTGNRYWQLSWAINKKTTNRYVRPEEVDQLKKAAEDFDALKNAVARIGEINRELWLRNRG